MVQLRKVDEKAVLEIFRGLPDDKRQELFDYLEFLATRDKTQKWLEFDAWAINLAKSKDFSNLTEDDVARIVSDFRGTQ